MINSTCYYSSNPTTFTATPCSVTGLCSPNCAAAAQFACPGNGTETACGCTVGTTSYYNVYGINNLGMLNTLALMICFSATK
jgi:hypothetical protein